MGLITGVIGMLCILTAFFLDQFWKEFNQDTVSYNVLNLVGASLLLYYAYVLHSWPFMTLNAVWLLIAGVKLIRISNNAFRTHS